MRGEVASESSISRPTLTELACQATVGHLVTPELIAAVIREAIVSGALSGRAQLRQSELAATFGVSIIPVREALRQLVAEGFVFLQRNRSATVADISAEDIKELFDLRIALEPTLFGGGRSANYATGYRERPPATSVPSRRRAMLIDGAV